MGIAKRKFIKSKMDISKTLKRPLLLVARTMKLGFTDEDFCGEFRRLQPILWQELQDRYASYKELNKIRKIKNRELLLFPKPEKFILSRAKHLLLRIRKEHAQGLYDKERTYKQRKELEEKAVKKVQKYREILLADLYFIQEVTPSYITKLISIYYLIRKRDNLNVDYRLWILQEVAKYRSNITIRFLKQVQCGEKNEELRLVAYYALNQMHAPYVKLHGKRKGRKKLVQIKKPQSMKTPQELLQAVYNAEYEKIKEFDVFISHSSVNKEMIHSIVKELNNSKKVCYVDWISDREQLNRQLTSKETAEVIVNRIKQSKVLLYVLTKECVASKWSAWELGYAYAIGKPIFLLQIDEVDDKPQFLDLYETYNDIQEVIEKFNI